ncbi:hypothetical protein MNBD_GAMMA07-465 [hydrothermal vent metagenome]|uniref:J domain-containing protein n=1 Tax=hydrothermal vent metagenome TaxID=652676 RepID=A0A3B0WX26_9ZZZZ
MHKQNPLILAILNILKLEKKSLSLYQLMRILENNDYILSQKIDNQSQDLLLFQKNFVVMNALYQLKSDLMDTGYTLNISSLKIELVHETTIPKSSLTNDDIEDDKTHAALSEYYLNWYNYKQTDEAGVEALLNSFWHEYEKIYKKQHETDKRLDSLRILGLESKASWKNIQQTYRQLVTICHPDKGGDSLQFIKIREAYLVLKLTQNMNYEL